jgi:hypothetical protein
MAEQSQALFSAVKARDLALAQLLLRLGSPTNQPFSRVDRTTALHVSIVMRNEMRALTNALLQNKPETRVFTTHVCELASASTAESAQSRGGGAGGADDAVPCPAAQLLAGLPTPAADTGAATDTTARKDAGTAGHITVAQSDVRRVVEHWAALFTGALLASGADPTALDLHSRSAVSCARRNCAPMVPTAARTAVLILCMRTCSCNRSLVIL